MDAGFDPEEGWERDGCDGEGGDDEGVSPCEIVRKCWCWKREGVGSLTWIDVAAKVL